jgi:hypothetical protein
MAVDGKGRGTEIEGGWDVEPAAPPAPVGTTEIDGAWSERTPAAPVPGGRARSEVSLVDEAWSERGGAGPRSQGEGNVDEAWSVRGEALALAGPTHVDDPWADEAEWLGFEPVAVEPGWLGTRDDYPFASEEDFEDDAGDWTAEDYDSTAQVLFGDADSFGQGALQRCEAEGFGLLPNNDEYRDAVARYVPELVSSVVFVRKGELIKPVGYVSGAGLQALQQTFPANDWSGLYVAAPAAAPQGTVRKAKLPPSLKSTALVDKVDLRALCAPEAGAGAWQKVAAMAERLLGTGAAPACVVAVSLDQLKTVLAAGCPVVVTMTLGPWFADTGSDGMLPASEVPREGPRHTLLLVGHVGNYFIAMNTWGADWGDRGCCYLPKKLLRASAPACEAVVWDRARLAAPAAAPTALGDATEVSLPQAAVSALQDATEPCEPVIAGAAAQGTLSGFSIPDLADVSLRMPAGALERAAGGAEAISGPRTAIGPGSELIPAGVPLQQLDATPAAFPATLCSPELAEQPEPGAAGHACPKCAATGQTGKFCQLCGAPLEAPAYCLRCGSQLRRGVRFCTQCAAPVQ